MRHAVEEDHPADEVWDTWKPCAGRVVSAKRKHVSSGGAFYSEEQCDHEGSEGGAWLGFVRLS